jgi:hypothetical protein
VAPARTSVSTLPTAAPASGSASGWGWWLLGLLVAVAAVVGIVMIVRARRAERVWETELAAAEAESTWLAHELVPTVLTDQDATARRATWTAYRPRVDALINTVRDVAASAPKDRSGDLIPLLNAVNELTHAMDLYVTAIAMDEREHLGAARQAQRSLEQALRAVQRAEAGPGEPVS